MPLKAKVIRVAKRLAFTVAALYLFLALLISGQQWLFRYRAQWLLADIQSVRLHQSTWSDAQTLMNRWGAWGHYDGACTSASCKYTALVGDAASTILTSSQDGLLSRLARNEFVLGIYRFMGGRPGFLEVGFIVQDGAIWRAETIFDVEIPPEHFLYSENEPESFLILRAQSRQSLRESLPHSHWILGGNEQIADHPNYKVGRPSGCESCLSGEVTYTPQTSQAEIRQFTNFNLSCFTRRKPCLILEDVLPVARKWHLYYPPWAIPSDAATKAFGSGPISCRTPVWALGRDATAVLAVEALSNQKVVEQGYSYEKATVLLRDSLKAPSFWPSGTQLVVIPYAGDGDSKAAEHLTPGKRSIVFINGVFSQSSLQQIAVPEQRTIAPDRCGIMEDNPQNRIDLQKGFDLNDKLRVSEF